jgi:tetratricopeptide (TPR) repeat protein
MLKKVAFLFLLLSTSIAAKAQMTDTLFNRMGDFDLLRFDNKIPEAITKGEQILPDSDKLPPKTKISFFWRLAKLYEDDGEDTNAIKYYEKMIGSAPDYYVAKRALGYLYDKRARKILDKLTGLKSTDPAYDKLFADYKAIVRKSLPLLEKAQACDPSDETLALIKALYKNIHDNQGLNSLDARLKSLNTGCLDILPEQ